MTLPLSSRSDCVVALLVKKGKGWAFAEARP